MNAKLTLLFQREATARLNAAEHEFVAFTRACRGTVVDLNQMKHIRQLREHVERARSRHLRWTRYRFLLESGVH
ncbi:MAG: hypothetical protein QM780_17935 [Hyphomicrobium sp.]|uniref:hypothetical protein n=1 Tax=Hyphomicrobium sp. TaxID=82 RepID=UPI0039E70AE5